MVRQPHATVCTNAHLHLLCQQRWSTLP